MRGDFTDRSVEGTAQLNAKAIGKVDAIDEILSLDADVIIADSKED